MAEDQPAAKLHTLEAMLGPLSFKLTAPRDDLETIILNLAVRYSERGTLTGRDVQEAMKRETK